MKIINSTKDLTILNGSIILLEPLFKKDIENLRIIRNSYVGKNIFKFDEIISKQKQHEWFSTLNKKYYSFFVVKTKYKNKIIGYVHCSQKNDNDIKNNCAEIGIILKLNIKNFAIPYQTISLLLNYCFSVRRFDFIYGVFNKENNQAIRFNNYFGFEKSNEVDGFITKKLHHEHYRYFIKDKCKRFLL